MEATLDMGRSTISSSKHGMEGLPLAQAANGHLLIPLVPECPSEAAFAVQPATLEAEEQTPRRSMAPPAGSTPDEADPKALEKADNQVTPSVPNRTILDDRRKHFQTIMKHTRYTQADVGTHRSHLRGLFGQDVDFAVCAYRPRYERTPKVAASQDLHVSVAHLSPQGTLEVSEWKLRPACARREAHDRPIPVQSARTTAGCKC